MLVNKTLFTRADSRLCLFVQIDVDFKENIVEILFLRRVV